MAISIPNHISKVQHKRSQGYFCLPTTGLATSGPVKWETRTRVFWGRLDGLSLAWAPAFLFFSLIVNCELLQPGWIAEIGK